MELHIILVFNLILALALYVFNFLFMMQYHTLRIASFKEATSLVLRFP